ncbi:MAG: hypothetical protein ACFFCF_01965 [Promethearchaeota archaeon]
MNHWHITFKSKERVLTDVLDKTGALMIRPRFINELRTISQINKVQFSVKSPEGVKKLPSSYFVVEISYLGNKMPQVTGLFEYAYGAIRLVALDSEELTKRSGDDMIAFFEAPLQKKSGITVRVFETKNQS